MGIGLNKQGQNLALTLRQFVHQVIVIIEDSEMSQCLRHSTNEMK